MYFNLTNNSQQISIEPGPQELPVNKIQKEELIEETQINDYVTEEEVDAKIAQALSEIPSDKETVIVQATPKPAKSITYISLGEAYSTTSTSWVDVPSSAVYIDVETDYGDGAKVSWEASLKVAHPTGKVFLRLFDDTHKIAVDYSEIISEKNSYEQLSTGGLPFWKGRNLYKVQIKSLNSFEVFYTAGKIKIAY